MLISNVNPTTVVVGQWIYIQGQGFDLTNTQVYFDNTPCISYVVKSDTIIVAMFPESSLSSCNVKLINGAEQVVSGEALTVTQVLSAPIIDSVTIDPITEWVSILGTNFVWNHTTVVCGSSTYNVSVDAPGICGFRKEADKIIDTITLTTPNGSVNFSV
jgi:hypothetical protein